jgi:hypothetical protein
MEGIYAIIASNAYGAVNEYFRLIVSEGMRPEDLKFHFDTIWQYMYINIYIFRCI